MDMLGSNEREFNRAKSMKVIKIIAIIIALLFLVTVGIIGAIYYLQSSEFKMYVDGSRVSKVPSDLIVTSDGKTYISINDFAQYVKYTVKKGTYKQYSEDITSCYVECNEEVANYTANSSTIYKKVKTSNDSEYEYFTLADPVKMINNKLYTTMEGLSIGCNSSITYDEKENTLRIYTLSYLTQYYSNRVDNAVIASEKVDFNNKKAILYGLVVIADEDGNYGVVDLNGNSVIGEKYKDIVFAEGAKEFIVTTAEDKIGIIGIDGTTKIRPEYGKIKKIYNNEELYLIANNNKYGVITKAGKTVIFPEYDAIGIGESKMDDSNIENNYVFYDNCIPVKKGDKWGLMSITGQKITDTIYDSFGCIIGTSNNKIGNNLLLIPEYEAIVVQKDKYYGLINSSGKELIPAGVTDMYSVTSEGKNVYYLTYLGETMNVIDYLQNELKIPPVNRNTDTTTNTITNTISTNVENTTNTIGAVSANNQIQ